MPLASRFADITAFIRSQYPAVEGDLILHAPSFTGSEKENLCECIDSTYVSYVGPFVKELEERVSRYTGAAHAVAAVNGTAALFLILHALGIGPGCGVVTQPLSFAATANAIAQTGAVPVFVDVDEETWGMSPEALATFFEERCRRTKDGLLDRQSGLALRAVMPMHTFGMPARIRSLREVCDAWGIPLIEDAAESLASFSGGRHTGTFGLAAALSFNGNKIVTTGGGGMVITDDEALAARIRHLSTTAKKPHPYLFFHDEVGYNLRMPNINAAVGCAQMDSLAEVRADKRSLHAAYRSFFQEMGLPMQEESGGSSANFWLNAVLFPDSETRDAFLHFSLDRGIHARPAWTLLSRLPMYENAPRGALPVAESLAARIVNIPSGARTADGKKGKA